MSGASTLCAWPPASDGGGCCAPAQATAVSVPAPIANAPGLPAIAYRIGTFTSFRQAMLDQVAAPDLLFCGASTVLASPAGLPDASIAVDDFTAFPAIAPFRITIDDEVLLVVSGAGSPSWTVTRGVDGSTPAAHPADAPILLVPANPFANWRAGASGDYHTIFVELWAYLADVLTFYQERIANEAFLGTATLPNSLYRLAELVDSQPSPGAGAAGLVAFTLARGQALAIPAGLRVGSRATPAGPAVTFETASAINARGDHNAMPVLAGAFTDQFATSAGTARQIVLAGASLNLRIGDVVVAVCNERKPGEKALAYAVQSVGQDPSSNTTTIVWNEPAGTSYDQSGGPVALYALRVAAGVFGNNAPAWATLPDALTQHPVTSPPLPPVYGDNWDQPGVAAFYVGYPGASGATQISNNTLDLDGVYASIRASVRIPGWIVVSDGTGLPNPINTQGNAPSQKAVLYHVTGATPVSRTGYTLDLQVTRLTLGQNETIPAGLFPIRSATVFAASAALVLQELPLPVSGTTLTLNGIFDTLQPGQTIVVQGPRAADGTPVAENHVLNGPPKPDATQGVTLINLTTALASQFAASGTVALGNVVAATQGETVRDEQLGDGRGTPFQSFVLKKSPLTFLPSTSPAGLTAVADTLTVTVNGVAWTEVANLLGAGADSQVFLASTDDTQKTTVSFGDGAAGALPPTGTGNIRARYRRGLGSSGNLAAGSIRQMIDSLPGLQGVSNPLPTTGGADPASPDQLRQTVAASLVTFGRAVSAQDYALLALQFPGIVKATANWVVRGQDGKPVPIPYMQLTVAVAGGTPIAGTVTAGNLRAFIDSHRDTNISLRILDFTPVPIDVSITVNLLATYPQQATLARVVAALNPGTNPDGSAGYFAFQNTDPGASLHLSAVYAAVQGVPGVSDALVTTLRPAGTQVPVQQSIFVRPTEIITIGNDPADGADAKGRLVITYGSGGFADS